MAFLSLISVVFKVLFLFGIGKIRWRMVKLSLELCSRYITKCLKKKYSSTDLKKKEYKNIHSTLRLLADLG